jgi:hypothetical protein
MKVTMKKAMTIDKRDANTEALIFEIFEEYHSIKIIPMFIVFSQYIEG